MKVMFIYPVIGLMKTFNCGIGSISAVLRENHHQTSLIELDKEDYGIVRERIRKENPEIVAFSCSSNMWETVKKLSNLIKKEFGLKIFAGGAHTTLFPETLKESKSIDGICIGEGEFAFLELVSKIEKGKEYLNTKNFWFNTKKGIKKNEVRNLINNLDSLPIPDRSIFSRETILNYPTFMFSRGCPFNCTYCCNHILRRIYAGKGCFIRFRGVDNCMKEIKDFVQDYNPGYLVFDDDSFTKDLKWLEEFCRKYKKEVNLPFYCNTRPELFSEEIAKLLKDAGCERINIGIESGDEEFRKKVLNRHMTNESIIKAFAAAKKFGLKTSSFNMVGLPGETLENFKKTIAINRLIQPDIVQISIFYPYPGTILGDLCYEKGYVSKRKNYNYFTDSILNLPTFKRKEIVWAKKTFEYKIYKERNFKKAAAYLAKELLTTSNSKVLKFSIAQARKIKNYLRNKLKLKPA